MNEIRRAMITRSLTTLLIVAVLTPIALLAADWPLFRGTPYKPV